MDLLNNFIFEKICIESTQHKVIINKVQFANSASKLLLIPFDWISLFSRIKVKSLDTFCYKPKKLSTLPFYFSQCLFTYDIDILGEFWVNKTLRSTE